MNRGYLLGLMPLFLGNNSAPMEGFRVAEKAVINKKIFKELPTLETERLILRKIQPNDMEELNTLLADEDITKWLGINVHKSNEDTKEFIEDVIQHAASESPNPWGLVHKKDNKLIGYAGFCSVDSVGTAMIWYAVLKHYWGQKLAPEALKKIIDCGFHDINFNRIEGYSILKNDRSSRVMEKCGMVYEGTLRECGYVNGGYCTSKLYAILKKDSLK
jgi:ribosomal-protein-alanine N-acetyltransferase